jgi:YidC/Oxa1 family membrane protein insertase
MVFIVSLLCLWESWKHFNGRDSILFGPVSSSVSQPLGAAPDTGVPAAAPKALAPSNASISDVGPKAAGVGGKTVQVATDFLTVDINSLGAQIDRLELVKHHDQTHSELNMVLLEKDATRTYIAQTGLAGGENFPNHNTLFEVTPGPLALAPGQDQLDVTFTAESGGVKLVKTYTFHRGSYEIDVKHQVTNLSDHPITPELYLQLVRDNSKPEGTMRFYSPYFGPAVYTPADKFQKVSFEDIEKGRDKAASRTADDGWVAMLQHYFVAAWIPPAGVARTYLTQAIAGTTTFRAAALIPLGTLAPQATATDDAKLFVGPEEERLLQKVAPGLDLTRDYGWTRILAEPVFWGLERLHAMIGNWGWAIIVLTIIIKAAFFPLSAASYRSMARMKAVAPRLKLLQDKYKDDRIKLNQAMMELYKAEKINPAGGCLPILIQIPVFISLYATLSASVEMRGAPWVGWIHDLGAPDPFYILPIIMMVSMFVQYKLNPAPADPAQAKVMMIMPLVFGITFFFFPAGLVLYWVTNNLLSIAQQYWITRVMSAGPAAKS